MTAADAMHDLKVMLGDPKEAVRTMSWPLILSFLVVQINSIADTSWCSMLGVDPSSAVSTISPFYWIIGGLGTGLGVGASTAIARMLGAGDKSSADSLVSQTMFISILLSLVTMPILWFLLDPSVAMMGAQELRDLCREYIDPIVFCTLALVINGVIAGIFRSEGAAKRSTIMTFSAAILNIILDPILMFGLDMGLAGAGWATGLSTIISTLIGLWWYFRGSMYLTMSFRGFRPNWRQIYDILFVGIPRSTEMILISVMSMIQRIFVIICGGTVGATLYNIPWRYVSLATVISQAVGAALTPIASAALGQRHVEKAQMANRYSLKLTVMILVVLSTVLFVFADYAVIPFSLSESMAELRPQLAHVVRIYAVLIPFVGMIDIGSSILQSIRMAQMSMLASFARNIIIVLFLFVACRYTMDAIFYSLLFAEVIGGFMMLGLARVEFQKVVKAGGDIEKLRS